MGTKPGKQNTRQADKLPGKMTSFRWVTAVLLLVTALLCLAYTVQMGDTFTVHFASSQMLQRLWAMAGYKDGNSTDTPQAKSVKTILLWNAFYTLPDYGQGFGQGAFKDCPVTACTLTNDKRLLAGADAVIFHARSPVKAFPKFRPPHQRYVFFLRESPHHAGKVLQKIAGAFDLTMTYRRDSDIPVPIQTTIKQPSQPSSGYSMQFPLGNRTRNVAWVVSHCETASKREIYARKLRKYIDVDIFGACGNTKGCPTSTPSCFKTFLPSRYKFYLGFENSVCIDYITEKTFRTLDTEIIPVVLGGTNYTRDTPPHSVINVMDFKSPRHLAEHLLWLGRNESEYQKYFEWKGQYATTGGLRSGFCKLCQILHTNTTSQKKRYSNVYQWWIKDQCHDNLIVNRINNDKDK